MIASFALSLSRDGIDLLHLAAQGWRRVGRVDIASETLDADLAALRAKALELGPDNFTSKVVIPEDQVKFLMLDKPDASVAEVHAALEGATPYSLFDLVVDQISEGGKTHIAAVARETLAEAESFADGHGFRPVAFVANPVDAGISQEFFFGPSEVAEEFLGAGVAVARGTPAIVSGTHLKLSPAPSGAEQVDSVTTESEAAPDENVASAAPVPVRPAYFDPVIPEIHAKPALRPAAKPQLVATPQATQPAPTKSLGAAPARNASAPAARGAIWPVAAGLAVIAAIGGGLFVLSGNDTPEEQAVTPATEVAADVVAEETPPPLEAGPVIGDAAVSTLALGTGTEESDVTFAPSVRPLSDPTPPPLALATADPLPITPLAPPPPPSLPDQTIAENDLLARAGTVGSVPTPDEARAFYEATGVWLRAPRFFDEPSGAITLGFERPAQTQTYSALRETPAFENLEVQDAAFGTPANPPPPDVVFARDERGFILATPEGAVTPEGAIVFAGLPDIPIVLRPQLSEEDLARMALLAPAPEGVVLATGTPAVEPEPRPEGLVPEELLATSEAPAAEASAPLGGVGIAGLELQESGSLALDTVVVERAPEDDPRPQLRPNGLTPEQPENPQDLNDVLAGVVAADATLRFDNSTALAVVSSLRPETRPSGFGDNVANTLAQRAAASLVAAAEAFELENEPELAASQSAPLNIQPIPGDVARAATVEDAIRLREINLIGIYGRPSERRALVRLSNGRYVRVEVGSELDGGQVVAIGDNALNYVKRGRTYAIALPEG